MSFVQSLKIGSRRLNKTNRILIVLRPFILLTYPSILCATTVSSLSVGWLIVLSESVAKVYQNSESYNFSAPIAIITAVGLMGSVWSAEEKSLWIVPTVFFGVISFGCSLGSNTVVTFYVGSYRQYAGKALVTLSFSKKIFHGLVFLCDRGNPDCVSFELGALYVCVKRAGTWMVRNRWMEGFERT